MVNVSKTQFESELRRKVWRRFLELVKQSPSEETLAKNLAAFLTPPEITMLEKRLAIPILLSQGLSYRTIGRAIDVSPTTVSFVKHHLTRKPRIHHHYDPLTTPRRKEKTTLFHSHTGRDRWRWLDVSR